MFINEDNPHLKIDFMERVKYSTISLILSSSLILSKYDCHILTIKLTLKPSNTINYYLTTTILPWIKMKSGKAKIRRKEMNLISVSLTLLLN